MCASHLPFIAQSPSSRRPSLLSFDFCTFRTLRAKEEAFINLFASSKAFTVRKEPLRQECSFLPFFFWLDVRRSQSEHSFGSGTLEVLVEAVGVAKKGFREGCVDRAAAFCEKGERNRHLRAVARWRGER